MSVFIGLRNQIHVSEGYGLDCLRKQIAYHAACRWDVLAPIIEPLITTGDSYESFLRNIFHGTLYGGVAELIICSHMWNVKISVISPESGLLNIFHNAEADIVLVHNAMDGLESQFSSTRVNGDVVMKLGSLSPKIYSVSDVASEKRKGQNYFKAKMSFDLQGRYQNLVDKIEHLISAVESNVQEANTVQKELTEMGVHASAIKLRLPQLTKSFDASTQVTTTVQTSPEVKQKKKVEGKKPSDVPSEAKKKKSIKPSTSETHDQWSTQSEAEDENQPKPKKKKRLLSLTSDKEDDENIKKGREVAEESDASDFVDPKALEKKKKLSKKRSKDTQSGDDDDVEKKKEKPSKKKTKTSKDSDADEDDKEKEKVFEFDIDVPGELKKGMVRFFQCHFCKKDFTKKYACTQHMKYSCKDNPEKEDVQFNCNQCDFKSARKQNLTEHINYIHLHKYTYVCKFQECKACFYHSAIKSNHEKDCTHKGNALKTKEEIAGILDSED